MLASTVEDRSGGAFRLRSARLPCLQRSFLRESSGRARPRSIRPPGGSRALTTGTWRAPLDIANRHARSHLANVQTERPGLRAADSPDCPPATTELCAQDAPQ